MKLENTCYKSQSRTIFNKFDRSSSSLLYDILIYIHFRFYLYFYFVLFIYQFTLKHKVSNLEKKIIVQAVRVIVAFFFHKHLYKVYDVKCLDIFF